MGWHGIPLPYLRNLLTTGKITRWSGKDPDPNDLGKTWWSKDLGFALGSYGGYVVIGKGWMIRTAVKTLATLVTDKRPDSFASDKVVMAGEIYVQAEHISSLRSGEHRLQPDWTEFDWDGFHKWESQHKTALSIDTAVADTADTPVTGTAVRETRNEITNEEAEEAASKALKLVQLNLSTKTTSEKAGGEDKP